MLRDLGEVDAAEHRRHRDRIKAGAAFAYPLDEGWRCSWLLAGAQTQEV